MGPDEKLERINIDLPIGLARRLEQKAEDLGVSRQSILKKWVVEQLDDAESRNSWFEGLSHDLRNPVHGILSYAGFGVKKGEQGELTAEKSLHYYRSIKEAGSRLLDLIEDIVLLIKLDTGKIPFEMTDRNLGTVMQGILSRLSKQPDPTKVSLNYSEPESPVTGRFDSRLIGDVIQRLINNCTHPAETNVELAVSITTRDPETTDNPFNQPAVCLTLQHPHADLSDQRLEDLNHLFNHGGYGRAAKGQAGLSFAVCQRIIAGHDGDIRVERRNTGGVEFGFILPA